MRVVNRESIAIWSVSQDSEKLFSGVAAEGTSKILCGTEHNGCFYIVPRNTLILDGLCGADYSARGA